MAIEWKKVAYFDDIKDASTTVKGIVELATDAETQTGTATTLVITPANLSARTATETRTGVAELATSAEAIAGTDTSRIVTPAGNAASEAVIKNPLQMAQGIEMTYAAAGSTGIQVADNDNLDFGTGNFTLVWKGSLPDWTPSATTYLMDKETGNYGYRLLIGTDGKIIVQVIRGSNTSFASTVAPALNDGTVHHLISVIQRETASASGWVTHYVDGVQLGSPIEIPAVNPPLSINTTATFNLSGRNTIRTASRTHFAATYNRALTAAEVLDLYRNGINYADKWGSQTAKYTSDFSAGVDGWAVAGGIVAGNIDSIGGYDDVLRVYADGSTGGHFIGKNAILIPFKKMKVSFEYYLPSTNTNVDGFACGLSNGSAVSGATIYAVKDAWTSVTEIGGYTSGNINLYFYLYDGAAVSFTGANNVADDLLYIKNVTITEVGATLALEPEGIQPAPGQWLDSSSNKLHAWQPTTGSTITRKKTEFEIRGINTWTASHAAQSIAMTSDASRAMLPANCYIESIVGVIAGADIEDIIIGNGSDTDYWVELTTGLAAGTVSFMLANRISDGTNYELVVDPDADCTMTITWTIKGYILD